MGHSLGGGLSFMYAASFPDDISQFISIDINGPPVRSLKKYAAMTGGSIDKFLSYETLPPSKLPCYSYEEMIDIVKDAYDGSIDREEAKILMIRGMSPVPKHIAKDGYNFARDLRLKVSLMGMFSLEHVLSYAEQIKCNVLNIRALPGMKVENPETYPMVLEAMQKHANVEYVEVEGTHHLHLTTPERIAGIISSFLLDPEFNEFEPTPDTNNTA